MLPFLKQRLAFVSYKHLTTLALPRLAVNSHHLSLKQHHKDIIGWDGECKQKQNRPQESFRSNLLDNCTF